MNKEETLDFLRWEADQCVKNHDGDLVWLKEMIVDGKRIGITDCCFANDPCDKHKKIFEFVKESIETNLELSAKK